jgi:hypothetical protein
MADHRDFGRRLRRGLTAAALAAALAACTPTVEYTTAVAVAPGVTVSLTLASGFRGTVDFRCRLAPPVTITGDETSILLVDGGIATSLTGGPYRYTAPGMTVKFEPGYQEVAITSVTGRRFCRG